MRYVIAAAALALAGCHLAPQPGMDPRINEVDLTNEGRNQLRGFFGRASPRAFAYSPQTRGHGQVWAAASTVEAETAALADCEERTGTVCELFAVDDEIVWLPPATGAVGEIGLRFRAVTDVNLRSGPNTSAEVLGVLSNGEQVEVTGVDGDWYAVQRLDGTAGFVFGDFLREDYGASGM